MNRFNSILFVATHSPGEKGALDRAVALARENDAQLTVVDTVETLPRPTLKLHTAAGEVEVNELVLRELREQLEIFCEPVRKKGVPVASRILCGTPFVEIVREVLRNGHDLVMKTATGKGGLREMLFGTTAMHLFRKCPCPVWLIKPTRRRKYTRILAAVDPLASETGSDSLTKRILDLATSLAQGEHSELHVVHAWQLPGESLLRSKRTGIDPSELKAWLAETRQAHEREIEAMLQPYRQAGHSMELHLLKGDPASHIVETAQKKRADLIVMGTLTRTGVAGLFIGNTAERVLQKVDCSVMAVKPDGFASPVTLDG